MIEQLRENPTLQIVVSFILGAILFMIVGAIVQAVLGSFITELPSWARDLVAGGITGAALGAFLARVNAIQEQLS